MKNAPTDDAVGIAQYVDLKTWLPGDILTKVDRTAMACSLEVRVPMLDHSFVNWTFGLPTRLKIHGHQGKMALKRALEPVLPREILYRPKQGFSVPLEEWFRGAFGNHLQSALNIPDELAEYIDPVAVRHLLLEHQKRRRDNSRTLWQVWMFMGFLRNVHASPAFALAS